MKEPSILRQSAATAVRNLNRLTGLLSDTSKQDFHSPEAVRTATNHLLAQFFEKQVKASSSLDEAYADLWSSLRIVTEAGGKRLRPYLTVLGYEAYGGHDYASILRVAAAQELFHTALLVHDDIADKDYVRHGVNNIAGQFQHRYATRGATAPDAEHYANAAALLGGDLALSAAHTMLFDSQFSLGEKVEALRLMNRATFEVAAGQLLDMEAAITAANQPDVIKIAKYKTSSYSFVIPLLTGAKLAGALAADWRRLEAFGYSLGIGFQLADDLLGTFGDEAKTGKSNTTDIREGKRTYLVQQTYARADAGRRARLDELLGKPGLSDEQAAEVRTIIEDSGARADTEALCEAYAAKARHALNGLRVRPEASELLEAFIARVIRRDC